MKRNTEPEPQTLFSEELQRNWLRWLAEKWASINRSYLGGSLRPPTFRIGWSSRRLGCWAGEGRILEIQGNHLAEDTATEVEYTLRHEMAHQVVQEILKSPHASPHGPLFIKACSMLGIQGGPQAQSTQSDKDDRIIRKTRKLLALASSSNTHEAATAMARAQEMLGKYNLDLDKSGSNSPFRFRWLGEPQGRVPLERKLVAEIIQEFFFVRCVWIRTYRVTKQKNATLLEAFGQSHNLEIASYIHDCLMRHLDELWANHRKTNKRRQRGDRSAFRVGVIMGFRDYLASLVSTREEAALIWSGDPALREFIASRHPRLVRSSGGRYQPGDALEAGRRQGKQLRIHPGVTNSKNRASSRRRLPRN